MSRVLLYTGGLRSGRERAIDSFAAEHWGQSLLVVPSRHEAIERSSRIIKDFNLPGAWGASVVSFEDFAMELLRSEGIFPHILDEFDRRSVVENVIRAMRSSGSLEPLGSAADSAGFANHILRVITKLKQAAVDPLAFNEAIARRTRSSWLDPIVASVYDAYQHALQQIDAFDHVGVYWQANIVLNKSRLPLFDNVRHVLFDGFDDFTPSEFRLAESVQHDVESLVFGLPCDPDATSRRDLYAIALATLEGLRNAFPALESRTFSEPPQTQRTHFVSENLFWRDQPSLSKSLVENLEFHPCHDIAHECEWIGRKIKNLIIDQSVHPNSIAVVYRRLDDVAPRVRITFREFQIPALIQSPPTLLDSSLACFLFGLLDAAEKWERERVLDVIISPWFGSPPEHVHAFSLLARKAGVIEGQQEWMECIQRFSSWIVEGSSEERDRLIQRMPAAASAAEALRASIARLDTWLCFLPTAADKDTFATGLLRIISEIHANYHVRYPSDEVREFESETINGVCGVLRRIARWEARLPSAGTISRSEFQIALRLALADAGVSIQAPLSGVNVLNAESARHHSFDYIFLAGLNEGDFPAPPTADAIYSDEDWLDLDRAGARIEKRSRQMEREMLLLHNVLGRTQKQAYVSWRLTNSDGKPLAPSPFVNDLKELSIPEVQTLPRSTSFLPLLHEVASVRDLRNVAPLTEYALTSTFLDVFDPIRIGCSVEDDRNNRAPFGEYDGIVTNPTIVNALAEHYGPNHAFSVAQLETYAQCPFQFYLERVLRIDETEVPEAEFDPRVRGRILHDVLQEFHKKYRGLPVRDISAEIANETMLDISAEVFDRHARREVTAPRGVIRVERARLQAQVLRYLSLSREDAEAWAPNHFEVGFGRAHATSEDTLTRADPLPLRTGKEIVLMSGRIDRIDLLGEAARIIDYKTTIRYQAKDIGAGVNLQLPLYAVAIQEYLLPGMECAEARLLQPGRDGGSEVLQRKRGQWPEREAAMRDGIARAVTGIRSGQFPPIPHENRCFACASSRVCRYELRRIKRKKTNVSADS